MAKQLKTDLLIIGAGAAGLSAALNAQQVVKNILLVCKGTLFQCGSTFLNRNGQWGVTFAATDREKEDLLEVVNRISRGTNRPLLSRQLIEESSLALEMLHEWGVKFQTESGGKLLRVPPCFCRQKLAALVQNCEQVAAALKGKVRSERITVLERCSVTKLLVEENHCSGGLAIDREGMDYEIRAGAVILATGGQAGCYQPNIVEPGLTGDGYRLLTDIGIKLKNMSFLQRVWQSCLESGSRFSIDYLARKDLSYVTVTGRTIELPPSETKLMQERMTHVPISNLQADRAVDQLLLASSGEEGDWKPITVFAKKSEKKLFSLLPFVQAGNGGVEIGCNGETPVAGLYGAGEVTTGMHGGDRVGGMMITSALVFGRRAGLAAAASVRG